MEPLKDSGKGTGGGARRHRLASALVVAEVALSLVLLAGSGLLIRSFANLQSVDLGLDPEGLLHARVPMPKGRYRTAADKQRFYREALGRIRALPGVVSAATGTGLPLFGGIGSDVDVPGKTHTETWRALVQLVSEGYAETLGLRLRQGRFLSEADVSDARRVAVVNETLARSYFGGDDPVGRTIEVKRLAELPEAPVADPSFEIVGVVRDAKNTVSGSGSSPRSSFPTPRPAPSTG